jgi:hypothetical protein
MAEIGQAKRDLLAALAIAVPALVAASVMWDFTVDDALISVRYARHVVRGAGWRFDPAGPATDGVTPLPWPLLLAPMARADPLEVLFRAKCINLAAWITAAAAVGLTLARRGARAPALALAALGIALSVPIAAHAVSGMETGLAMALATAAVILHGRPLGAAACAGLAASLRPEMGPWAVVLASGLAWRAGPRRAFAAGAVALGPFAVCVLVRVVAFGRPAPLALMAKPSDVAHGAVYAAAALVVCVTPILALAPRAALRAGAPAAAPVVAAALHALAVVAVGGDWMPYARLVAPVAPGLAYAAALALPHARLPFTGVRAAVALAAGVYAWIVAAPGGRHVGTDRARLVAEARPYLRDARAVAAVDVGWLSAATDAKIVDCAGVTDPEIAALPGGHTSKRVELSMLLGRGVDRVVLLAKPNGPDWKQATFARAVEARLASEPRFDEELEPMGFVRLGTTDLGYFVFALRESR